MKVKPPPPLDVKAFDPESYPSFWINHGSRLLMRQFEERLRPLGVGMAYLPVLMALEEKGPLLQKDLAEQSRVEQPTMAALLARMDRDGLVTRIQHPNDKRASLVTLTPKAKKAMPKALEQLRAVADRVTIGFDGADRAAFLRLLKRAVANLEETREDG